MNSNAFIQQDYFDHEADIGIIGRGTTIEKSFAEAAGAMFAIMADLKQIKPKRVITIDFQENDIELALVIWLNELINIARREGLFLSKFNLIKTNNQWHGQAWGEPWNDAIDRGTEVKGATLTMLSVKKVNNYWESRCVVDV